MSQSRMWTWLLPVLPVLATAAAGEFLVRYQLVPAYLLPTPSNIFRVLVDEHQAFAEAALATLSCAMLGLGISFVIGLTLSIAFSQSRILRLAFYPYAVFFQTVPVIAIAPLLVIWFGFGAPTVIASAALVAVFPVIANTMLGLSSTDKHLNDLFRLYQASTWQRLAWLTLPFALPQIFAGLRIAAGLALIGAIVGEFIGGGGLGSLIDSARTQQRVDMVFAAVIVSAMLGLAMVAAVDALSRRTLRSWHASANQG